MSSRPSKSRRLAVWFTAITAALALAGCSGRSESPNTNTTEEPTFNEPPAATNQVDSLTWATRGEPGTLDSGSAFGGNSLVILGNVCESLVTMAEDNTIEPLLASKVDHPDPTTYVFTLRTDVKFFDGSTMTADDVVFSLKRTLDPATGSFFGSYGKTVASVEATGTDEVTVKLTRPDPVFYQMLASPMGQVVKKKLRRGSRQGVRHVDLVAHVHRPLPGRLLEARRFHLGGGQHRVVEGGRAADQEGEVRLRHG